MGNAAFCAPSIISNGVVKILSSDGRLIIYASALPKAAEIMLENPNQFLCESSHLKVGQRIVGLTAEEELERGELYFLLPMDMLYSVLTTEEMNWLNNKASKGTTTFRPMISFSKFRLFPNNSNSRDHSAISSDLEGNGSMTIERFSRQRSWEPALDTIVETPPHS